MIHRRTALTVLLAAGLLLPTSAGLAGAEETANTAESAAKALEGMNWLAGCWSGTTKRGRWEAGYTSSSGGVLVSANKEWVGDRVVMFEFEMFRVVDNKVVLQPFPNGRKTDVSFTLVESDSANRRAVFANPEHDFPNRISYHCPENDRLIIDVTGEMSGRPVTQRLDLRRVAQPVPAGENDAEH